MISPTPDASVYIGPTWQRRNDAKKKFLIPVPERTMGWQVLKWTFEYLRQPDGPNAGDPWHYTDEQARFILWWFAVDEKGRFIYRYGMLRRVKGWGLPRAKTLSARRCARSSSSGHAGSNAGRKRERKTQESHTRLPILRRGF